MKDNRPVGMEFESLRLLENALNRLNSGFQDLDRFENNQLDVNRVESILLEVAERMQDNFPYFHPQYAGQMMNPPHPVARLAYMLSLYINPNNHALDGGRASSHMEKEAVAQIAGMFGWEKHLGHLTSGGTMANMEALWVSGLLHPGRLVLASSQAHYTHERISKVLHLPFRSVPVNRSAQMSIPDLQRILDMEDVGTVVATVGTTAAGMIDPLIQILELQEQYHFRIHVDAAYGGYFTLARNLSPATREVFDRLSEADSIVVDPHKHGLQPFGCGCILFKDPSVGCFYKHDSPYTYFSSDELHLGEISLECSHPGAAAVALWATQKMMPLISGGEMSGFIEKSRRAALDLYQLIQADSRFITPFKPDLDIVIWAPVAGSVSEASEKSKALFLEAQKNQLHLALADLPIHFFESEANGMEQDDDHLVCLRSVLMKPEHEDWLERIWDLIDRSAKNIGL